MGVRGGRVVFDQFHRYGFGEFEESLWGFCSRSWSGGDDEALKLAGGDREGFFWLCVFCWYWWLRDWLG